MDNYQYRLLQLSIPTRTTKKEQEQFLRDIYERHIPISARVTASTNSLLLFKEAYNTYHVTLPPYIMATVLTNAAAKGIYTHFN